MVGEYWVHYKHKGKMHKFASVDTKKRTEQWAKGFKGIKLTPRNKPQRSMARHHHMTTLRDRLQNYGRQNRWI